MKIAQGRMAFAFGMLFSFSTMTRLDASGPSVDANGRKTLTDTDKNGNTAVCLGPPIHQKGGFEVKQTDKNGHVIQWYQHFNDADGKEMVEITRITFGGIKPPYESIQYVTTYQYNKDRNVSETFEFDGDGTLRKHTVYRYDSKGKWLVGDMYDSSGKLMGHESTPPEFHFYGQRAND